MTITLEAIEAQQSRINDMIAAFKAQPLPTVHYIDAASIPLAAGERFAGAVLFDDGSLQHYLILIPAEAEALSWSKAREWAQEQGGCLPTRQEQSLLFANLKGEFESAYYWSDEVYEPDSSFAWCQHFGLGTPNYYLQSYELRARAVRRFIPSVF